jgi:DNA-binding response OmpR family regulator
MASVDLSNKTILIVEDEFFIGSNLEQIFQGAGASTVLVNNADDALKSIYKTKFDAVVLDIHLQDGSTYPVADELRRKSTPFMFLSGYLTIREGYTDIPFLDKPFTEETALNGVNGLLR